MKKRVKCDPEWVEPVIVQIGRRPPEFIRNAAEALSYLTNRWPPERGRQYRMATATCSAALRRQVHSNAARETFLSAAQEARMLG